MCEVHQGHIVREFVSWKVHYESVHTLHVCTYTYDLYIQCQVCTDVQTTHTYEITTFTGTFLYFIFMNAGH